MRLFHRSDDADLLLATGDDVAAFEALYRRYVERVTAFAVRRCGNAEDAADVVAQTFVRLLRVAGDYDPDRGEPAAFVYGVASNAVRDVHRARSRQRALESKLAGRDLLDADDIERLETAVDAAQTAAAIRAALDGVPSGEQQVVRLVADGRTTSQAASEMGISPAAARKRLSRARRRVRARLHESAGEDR